jgi:hypothetical protein
MTATGLRLSGMVFPAKLLSKYVLA